MTNVQGAEVPAQGRLANDPGLAGVPATDAAMIVPGATLIAPAWLTRDADGNMGACDCKASLLVEEIASMWCPDVMLGDAGQMILKLMALASSNAAAAMAP